MSSIRPIVQLDTHEVLNQPPPFEEVNLFTGDRALADAVARAGGARHRERLTSLGARCGSAEVIDWGVEANRNIPVLESYDRFGQRIDEVRFHPAYHQLMRLGLDSGLASVAWDGTPAGHVAHAAILFLTGQADSGTSCPMTMTYAAVPALRADEGVAGEWVPRITAGRYDPASRPAAEKAGVTIGMAMTEKQGGSDVRANTTRAEPAGEAGWYSLTGHKWFCSAPMCDAFLTLAYAQGGLTCFLVPRWLPDGTRNAGFRVMRLKDKLGDRSNASSEIEYHGALAQRLGEEGRGVATIIQMVQHTRLDCVIGSAQQMRGALAQALWHTAHRSAFQRRLIDQPAMAAVLADLAVESEAATALGLRLAQAFDEADPVARLLTPIAKYWVCKRAPGLVYEAMECHGGAGYIEAGPMPRLFRQSPLNAIWEGSGNVIALDLLRAIGREPGGVEAINGFLAAQRGRDAAYDAWIDSIDLKSAHEGNARLCVEQLALAAQGAVLLGWDSPAAEAFCRLRLSPRGSAYGAFDAVIDTRALIERAMPVA
ncbi:DNA alkylation response protein [Sphingomonas koreensis]|jgi:putative acyl-CoA dehydrogenase|uniref:DNA alkylation response protein n=1 Tax=Sphingomonas koreensis TaxID=93064 RepID=A0A1L6JAD7_9SPHN|nr:acyl-CoA dehydrogenase family protein [Sphingomonas koreensis]APR52901.1 DNA alkylation response protein [Sphingomonas koreensis]MDC7811251.1 acyl-CoA dehydrogenase family protein [Sphingomonas koreensis]RSU18095.1 DNA alkylation response protein [Sphingomonas koreensis]RSU23407.1 DNA alkylation response protein [Sphingomonas koreensis]RSU25368.1 DNA alkylation response protein [Sphingomonas koreensis]